MINDIILKLNSIPGLNNVTELNKKDKPIINNFESIHNLGVKECISRKFTLVLTHDDRFRDPVDNIVIKENGHYIFPGISFPEVKANDVVSSSPSKRIHEYLIKKYNFVISENDATLLIGFNL